MKIGVIVASSNCTKNELLYNAVCKAARKYGGKSGEVFE